MKTLTALFALLLLAAPAQAQGFSKCRTVSGTIIVVQGIGCPIGSIYIGPA